MRATDETRGRFLDLQYLRNRRLFNSQHRVRQWYTNVDQWLEGTRAAEAAVSYFEEEVRKIVLSLW